MENRAWTITRLFTVWFAEHLIPLLGTSTQKTKKIAFKIGLLFDNAPGHPRALMGLTMCSEINVVPMAANPTSIL